MNVETIEVPSPRELPSTPLRLWAGRDLEQAKKWAERRGAEKLWWYTNRMGVIVAAVQHEK
jgi:hypothetical protein